MLCCGKQALPSIEAIIFDKDGTLAETRQFLIELAHVRSQRCAAVVSQHTHPSPEELVEHLLAIFGVYSDGIDPDGLMAAGTRQANIDAAVEALRKVGLPASEAVGALVANQFALADGTLRPKAIYTPPFPGTKAMLQRLNAGVRLGVLSSDSPANVEEFLTHYGLLPWVDDWQGTEPEDIPKPEPDLLYRLCDRMGVRAAHTVIVGDSWVDQALAKNAGAAAFISVSEPWGRSPVAGADLVLTDWGDLALWPDSPSSGA